MEKINFEDGELIKSSYVEINGEQHQVHEAEYDGTTPLSAFVLNKMQDNIEKAIGNAILEMSDNIVTETATITQNGLMSKEDKTKLDTLENTEVIQEDGEATTENVYSANAVKNIVEELLNKQKIVNGVEFETGRIIDGKVEYGKILNIGVVPSATSKTYATGITNFDRYTYLEGYTDKSWGVRMTPEKINESSIVLNQEGANLKVTTYVSSYANADYKGYIEMHYIKSE